MSRTHVLQTEQAHHQQAFEVYYGLGAKRTYQEAAKQLGLSTSTLKLMARSFGWSARIAERDATVARQAADQVMQTAISDSTRKRRIVDMALIKVAKAINADKVKVQVADLDRLLRLQHFLDGGQLPLTVESFQGRPPMEVFGVFIQWYTSLDLDDQKAIVGMLRARAEQRRQEQGQLAPPAETAVPQGQEGDKRDNIESDSAPSP
jgi:hypothetical protein